jgi:hypothetical protein
MEFSKSGLNTELSGVCPRLLQAARGHTVAAIQRKATMSDYPVRFNVDYPDRDLNRLTTFFRIFMLIPIAIVLGAITGFSTSYEGSGDTATTTVVGGIGILFLPTLLLILFRQKYPRWWYEWNLNLQRFMSRVGVYAALMDDRYPSTDEEQSVRLEYPYPNVPRDLGRGMPLVKWFLAIPHYLVLAVLFGLLLEGVPAGLAHDRDDRGVPLQEIPPGAVGGAAAAGSSQGSMTPALSRRVIMGSV